MKLGIKYYRGCFQSPELRITRRGFNFAFASHEMSSAVNRIISYLVLILLNFTIFAQAGVQHTDSLCGYRSVESMVNANKILSRPLGLDSTIITAHFAIHYSITEGDSNQTTEAYAESTAVVAEFVWQIEYESLGWRKPLSDGDTLYDIYIRKVVDGSLGRTIPEASGLSNLPCQSYVELRMGQTMSNLRHTLAHELHHASQYSYAHEARASDRGAWFYENTAEWVTQYVVGFTDIQFLNRVNGFSALVAPYHKITYSNGSYEYGGALWCNFLMEWTGDSLVIRKIWERMSISPGQQILKDIDTVLFTQYGKKLDEAISQYAIWRSFTGKRADAYHFKYASRYTALKDSISSVYPFSIHKSNLLTKPVGPGGCKYYIFKKSGDSITFTFHGEERHRWKVYVIGLRIPQPSFIDTLSLDSLAYGAKTFYWSQADSFTVIPLVLDTTVNSPSLGFSLSAFDTNAVSIQFTNIIHGSNAGGSILLDQADTVRSGDTRILALGSLHTSKPLRERFTLAGDSTYKHHDWNGAVISLTDSFKVDSTFSSIANFTSIVPVTMNVSVEHFPSMTGGAIQFSDPWYIQSAGTQTDTFITYSTPFVPTGAYNQSSGGIFLNQSVQSGRYYSIRAESTQILGGYDCTFDHWDTLGVTLSSIGDVPGINQQAVVFTSAYASLTAVYVRGKEVQFISIDSSWNLISLPAILSDSLSHTLFPGAQSPAYYFDAVNHVYTAEVILTHGKGYWIKYREDTILPITGDKLYADTIDVVRGWNLIGSLSNSIEIQNIQTEPAGILDNHIYGYNKNGYFSVDAIEPGKGYWIKVHQSGKIILNDTMVR